jgi:hypothetical protein
MTEKTSRATQSWNGRATPSAAAQRVAVTAYGAPREPPEPPVASSGTFGQIIPTRCRLLPARRLSRRQFPTHSPP